MKAPSTVSVRYPGFEICEVGSGQTAEINSFVFEVYRRAFSGEHGQMNERDRLAMLTDDFRTGHNSRILIARSTQGEILATVRIIRRAGAPLPMERDFGLDCANIFHGHYGFGPNEIFEIGRFAADKRRIRNLQPDGGPRFNIIDCLLAGLFQIVSGARHNLIAAAIDIDVREILKSRGIFLKKVGPVKEDYLGSPTVATILPIDVCREEMLLANPGFYRSCFEPEEIASEFISEMQYARAI